MVLSGSSSIWQKLVSISFMSAETSLQQDCFRGSLITEFSFPDVTEVGGDAFKALPNATAIFLPKLTTLASSLYVFGESTKLRNVQLGSVGYTVTSIRNNDFLLTPNRFSLLPSTLMLPMLMLFSQTSKTVR